MKSNGTRFFPPAQWLAEYRAAWLRHDVIAGVTLAAYAIPVSLAYAALAGLPPQVGVYGYMLGGIGYALLGSSRQLAVGPTSAISLMIAASVGALAGWRCGPLCPDRESCGFCRRVSLPDRLDFPAQHAGTAGQRQHSGRLQGWRRPHHHHDAVAEPVRRRGRRTQFLPNARSRFSDSSATFTGSYWPLDLRRSRCCCLANGSCPEDRSGLPS